MNPDNYCYHRSSQKEKPPLGLTPKRTWEEMRKEEIKAAINRYMEANKAIPLEWIEELNSYLND